MFQIGDRVRVVKNTSGPYACFDAECIGKEGEVVGRYPNRNTPWIHVQLDDDDDWMAFMPEELGPVEPAARFRAGDNAVIPNLDGTCTVHDFVTDRNLRLRPEHAKLIFVQNERILQSVSPSEE